MTREEEAQLAKFRTQFETFMQERQERDAQQVIGREYDARLDPSQDVETQTQEKEQRIDYEFMEDQKALHDQDSGERREFDEWMKGQRNEMRGEDATLRQAQEQEARKHLTYTPPELHRQYQDATYEQRENNRRIAADTMREEFDDYQTQKVEERKETLTQKYEQNSERVDTAAREAMHHQEGGETRHPQDRPEPQMVPQEPGVPSRAPEEPQENRPQEEKPQEERPHDPPRQEEVALQREATVPQEGSSPQQPDKASVPYRPLPGESEAEAQARFQEAEQGRHHEEQRQERQPQERQLQEQSGARTTYSPLPGESEAEVQARSQEAEQRRAEQEQRELQEKQMRTDDWSSSH